MIGFLKGTVAPGPESGSILLMAEGGGVGYVVSTSDTLVDGSDVSLHVVTVVKEESFSLYGFQSASDASIYRRLTRINGVGPQMGLNLLRALGGSGAVAAIISEDVKTLTSVSGIGPSVAKKIIAAANFPADFVASVVNSDDESGHFAELHAALVELGYDTENVRDALEEVDSGETDEEAMKIALNYLRSI